MRRTVLLVEDEAKLADVLAEQLAEEDFDVRQAGSLRQALRLLDDLVPDIAVIDIGLPDGSGLDVLRRLRCGADRLDSGIPVLLLTARTEEVDVLRGFDRGADDYLRKPFALPELIARVNALLARGRRVHADIRVGELLLEPSARRATWAGRELPLSGREYDLLLELARDPGAVRSKPDLLREVWRMPAQASGHERLRGGTPAPTRSRSDPDGAPAATSLRRRRLACESTVRVRSVAGMRQTSRSRSALERTAPGIARELEQQVVLAARERQLAAGPGRAARRRLEQQIADADVGMHPAPAYEQRVHAGDQLGQGERLAQIVVGAALEAAQDVGLLDARREHAAPECRCRAGRRRSAAGAGRRGPIRRAARCRSRRRRARGRRAGAAPAAASRRDGRRSPPPASCSASTSASFASSSTSNTVLRISISPLGTCRAAGATRTPDSTSTR